MATQREVTAAIKTVKAVKRTPRDDDEAAAVADTRRLLREAGPDAVALLHHCIVADRFASPAQRVRAAIAVLEAGGLLFDARVFGEPGEPDSEDEARWSCRGVKNGKRRSSWRSCWTSGCRTTCGGRRLIRWHRRGRVVRCARSGA